MPASSPPLPTGTRRCGGVLCAAEERAQKGCQAKVNRACLAVRLGHTLKQHPGAQGKA